MKIEKQYKIVAYIICALIIATGLLSVAFVLYPFVAGISAPKLILDILTFMNLLIPSTGIIAMLSFIFKRKKQSQ